MGLVKSFVPKFVGPFQITKIMGDLNYQIESPNLRTQIVHYNRLSKFNIRINKEFCSNQVISPEQDPLNSEEQATANLVENQVISFISLYDISKLKKHSNCKQLRSKRKSD